MSSEKNEMLVLKNTSGKEFFVLLEEYIKTKIPITLKNVLLLNGFDNVLVLSKFNDACLCEIE